MPAFGLNDNKANFHHKAPQKSSFDGRILPPPIRTIHEISGKYPTTQANLQKASVPASLSSKSFFSRALGTKLVKCFVHTEQMFVAGEYGMTKI